MKKILSVFLLLIFFQKGYSQFTYKIKADSLLVTNDSCNAELNLENSTRNVNGFLYNKGNGRTEFRRGLMKINDSIYVIGSDTLKLKGSGRFGVEDNTASEDRLFNSGNYDFKLHTKLGYGDSSENYLKYNAGNARLDIIARDGYGSNAELIFRDIEFYVNTQASYDPSVFARLQLNQDYAFLDVNSPVGNGFVGPSYSPNSGGSLINILGARFQDTPHGVVVNSTDTSIKIGVGTSTNDWNLKGIRVKTNKDLVFDNYPSTRNDGSTSKALYVDATGNLKYGTVSSGSSYTFSNGLTNSSNNVKLGGALVQNTTIDGSSSYDIGFTNINGFSAWGGSGTTYDELSMGGGHLILETGDINNRIEMDGGSSPYTQISTEGNYFLTRPEYARMIGGNDGNTVNYLTLATDSVSLILANTNIPFKIYNLASTSDTTSYKPFGISSSGQIKKLNNWPAGMSSNIYNSNGTLTGSRTITGAGNDFAITGLNTFYVDAGQNGQYNYFNLDNNNAGWSLSETNGTAEILLNNGGSTDVNFKAQRSDGHRSDINVKSDSILITPYNGKLILGGLLQGSSSDDILTISGAQVKRIPSSSFANGWGLTGNSGTNPSTNFLGTTDSAKLIFKTSNTQRASIFTDGTFNIAATDTTSRPLFRVYPNGDITLKAINNYGVNTFAKSGVRYIAKLGLLQLGISDHIDTTMSSNYGSYEKTGILMNTDDPNNIRGGIYNSLLAGYSNTIDSSYRLYFSVVSGAGIAFHNSFAHGMISGKSHVINSSSVNMNCITGFQNTLNHPTVSDLISGGSNTTSDTSYNSLISGMYNNFGGNAQLVAGSNHIAKTPSGTYLGNRSVDFTSLNFTGIRGISNLDLISNLSSYPILSVGNSSNNSSTRSNALTILYNGRTQINTTGFTNNLSESSVTPKAALEIVSNNSGVLLPKLTTGQRDSIISGDLQNGLLLYNNDVSKFQFYDGSTWKTLCDSCTSGGSSNSWNLTGNSGTSPATNFLGTTDGQRLVFRTNNTEKATIDTAGKVGIATSSPQYKLDVNGDARINTLPFGSRRDTVLTYDASTKQVKSTRLPSQSKSITIGSPSSSENATLFYTTDTITVAAVRVVMLGTSQSLTYTLNYGASRATADGTIVASNTFDNGDSGYQTTGFAATLNTTTIPAGSYIWLTTSAKSGTINDFNLTITYR